MAAIWAYESATRYFESDGDGWSARSRAQTQNRTLFPCDVSQSRKRRFAALGSKSEASLAKTPVTDTHAAAAGTGTADDLFELRQMIVKLSGQVEALGQRLEQREF